MGHNPDRCPRNQELSKVSHSVPRCREGTQFWLDFLVGQHQLYIEGANTTIEMVARN